MDDLTKNCGDLIENRVYMVHLTCLVYLSNIFWVFNHHNKNDGRFKWEYKGVEWDYLRRISAISFFGDHIRIYQCNGN